MLQRRKTPPLAAADLAAATRLFSPSIIRAMVAIGRSSMFDRLIAEIGAWTSDATRFRMTVGDAFDAAFGALKNVPYRTEYTYKSALTEKILLGTHSVQTARMLTEFRVGACKADVVLLNGTSSVYEIKSERDSLTRLPLQLETYAKIFEHVNVITSRRHEESVRTLAPKSVGVLVLSDRYQISTIRKARSTKRDPDREVLFESLQREELKLMLRASGIAIPTAPNIEMHAALHQAFSKIPAATLRSLFVATLKKTREHVVDADSMSIIPKPLWAFVISLRLSVSQQSRLARAVSRPLNDALLSRTI